MKSILKKKGVENISFGKKYERTTKMAISNCLFSPNSENPRGFSVWCVLVKLIAKPRNYS